MSVLHTVNKSPFTHNTLKSCISICASDDGILLLEDGVFGALEGTPDISALHSLHLEGTRIYVLIHDAKARGIELNIVKYAQLVTYDEFVSTTLYYRCVQSWY